MRKYIKTSQAPTAFGPYSQAILCNGFLFVSGQLPMNPQTGLMVPSDIKAQTRQVLENAKAIVESSSLSLENVVKYTCFLISTK
ncbi:MAG: hypothetical protein JW855_02100 [Gammaproteobacteria bacterium]|nr:hypothetical protein [Gammaproteobacteria bacterium]